MSRQTRSARQRYLEAWEQLSRDALLDRRQEYFGQPSRITGPRLPDFVGANGAAVAAPRDAVEGFAEGHVLASLTVDASGAARDAVVIESEPPGLLDQQLLRTLRETAFRPAIRDGDTVASTNVQYRHAFRYATGGEKKEPGPTRGGDQPLRNPAQ
jgi:TonB family protein